MSLLFLFSLFFAAPQSSYDAVVTTKETPVYVQVQDEQRLIGILPKGQTYYSEHQIDREYIEIGNGNATILDHAIQSTTLSERPIAIANQKVLYEIITIKRTAVWTNQDNTEKLATIEANWRLPIVKEEKGYVAVLIGGRVGWIEKKDIKKSDGVSVLLYHHLLWKKENTYFQNSSTVSVENFKRQMNFLHQSRYLVTKVEDLHHYLDHQQNLPAKTVILTFDDGIKSNYVYAYPILKKYGFKATEFIISSRISEEPTPFHPNALQFLSHQEMEQMKDVFSFHNHTHELHGFLLNKPLVHYKTATEIYLDLLTNQRIIQSKYIAYPFGVYNDDLIQSAKDLAISLGFTTQKGKVQLGDNPYLLKRNGVEPNLTLYQFSKLID